MRSCYSILACGAVALALYLPEKIKGCSVKALLLKSLVSLLFLAEAVCAWYTNAQTGTMAPMGCLVIMGLLFGLLGDVWLDLKYVYPGDDRVYTYAGFGAFGVGHLLYQTGLLLQFARWDKPFWIVVPLLLALALGFGNAWMEKPMKLRYGEMKPVVIAYGALLFFTVLLSGSMALQNAWKETALNLFFAGGVLFAISDLVLSGTYFGQGKERPRDLIANYLTYYPGQYLIALSLLFVR